MLEDEKSNTNPPKTWRQNWFIKNVLAETPVFGPFFQAESIPEAIYHSSKHAAMLLGGSAGMALRMMLNAPKNSDHDVSVQKMPSSDSMALELTSMVGYMSAGMMVGTVTHNMLMEMGRGIYNCCRSEPQVSNQSNIINEEGERQKLSNQ